MNNTGELVTSFTSLVGPHPRTVGQFCMIAMVVVTFAIMPLDAMLPKKWEKLMFLPIVLMVPLAIGGVMGMNARDDQIRAVIPSLSKVAAHYGLTPDPQYKEYSKTYADWPQGRWVDAKGDHLTNCSVFTRKIDGYHYGHKLSCLKVGNTDTILFPEK